MFTVEIVNEVTSSHGGITDCLLRDTDVEYFTDGNSVVFEEDQNIGYTVVTLDFVVVAHLCLMEPLLRGLN